MYNDLASAFIPTALFTHSIEKNKRLFSHLNTLFRELQEDKPIGQHEITQEMHQYFFEIHNGRQARVRPFNYDAGRPLSENHNELWSCLTQHRRGNDQQLYVHLMGLLEHSYPSHPKLGALYAGDRLLLINHCVLLQRSYDNQPLRFYLIRVRL